LWSAIIQFFTRNHFRKEITIVLALKFIALILLWKLFVPHSDPQQLSTPKLVEHFISVQKYT